MFGKSKAPKALKDLEVNLLATQTLFRMYAKLPPDKQQLAMTNNPRDLADAVREAVESGHKAKARDMVEATSRAKPAGVTAEQWAAIMQPAFAELQ